MKKFFILLTACFMLNCAHFPGYERVEECQRIHTMVPHKEGPPSFHFFNKCKTRVQKYRPPLPKWLLEGDFYMEPDSLRDVPIPDSLRKSKRDTLV